MWKRFEHRRKELMPLSLWWLGTEDERINGVCEPDVESGFIPPLNITVESKSSSGIDLSSDQNDIGNQ